MRFVGIIFLFLGLISLAIGISMGVEGLKAKRWPRAKGRIIKSKITELRSKSKIRIARLCLELEYLYLVGEKIFEGHRYDTGWRCFASEDHIKNIIENYPVGKEVLVYYNPQNPQRSLLMPGLNWSVFLMTGVGIVILSVTYPILRQLFIRRNFPKRVSGSAH